MSDNKTPRVEIEAECCKGCELCISQCPPKVLAMNNTVNHMGYVTAEYTGDGCTGCGFCFYACPEPGAITVYKKERAPKEEK